jgi:hypothetical protein
MSSLQPNSSNSLRLAELIADKRAQQNILAALVAGFVASLVGAVLWAVVTVTTEYQIGFMAVGVGLLVGYAVRVFGKGIDTYFGYIGAGFSVLGCLLGNLLSAVGFVSQHESVSVFAVLSRLDIDMAGRLMGASFSLMDLLFYFIGIQRGYSFAFVRISPAEMAQVSAGNPAITASEPTPAPLPTTVDAPPSQS